MKTKQNMTIMGMTEFYMERCFHLARLGCGNTKTNPMVGCVIVHENRIIGEGFHQAYGYAHAEVNAINAVADHAMLKESTLYVNLEPCAHVGKTPPCADLIIEKNIPKVVICNTDPNPQVAGRGIAKMRSAGINVLTDVLEQNGRFLNRRFFTWIEKKRPYILLKWAQTVNGKIDIEDANRKDYWISNDALRVLVHRWRSEENAILVGYNTAKNDDPQLNIRYYAGQNPDRIVIDPKNELSPSLQMFCGADPAIKLLSLDDFIAVALENKWQSVMVEGGKKTLEWFLQNNLWDEARVLIGNTYFASGLAAPQLPFLPQKEQRFGEDIVCTYLNEAAS